MSRDIEPDDRPDPRRPRSARPNRPKKGTPRGDRPPADPGGTDSEPSTFRPNPYPGASPRERARAQRGGSARSTGSGAADRPSAIADEKPGLWERIFFGNVDSGRLAQFCRQLAGYLHSGVDLLKALDGLERQYARTALGPALARIQTKVRAGATLEEAMRGDERIFGSMFLSMIKVAEARGGVPETLRMMARHFEARRKLIRQARSAMIYPVIVLLLASGVIALITIFLLPMFADLLADVSRKAVLPLPSRMLMAFSGFMRTMGWWLLPAVAIAAPIALYSFYKTEPGKSLLDRILLRIPVFGPLALKIDTTRFARTLSTLLDAGVDFGSSIDLTADVVMLRPIRDALLQARPMVLAGKDLSRAIAAGGRFNQDVIAVISSGEETGKLPESLALLADDYEEQVGLMVKNLGQLIQPFLILFLGGIVLFIILAVLMPYIQLLTSLSG